MDIAKELREIADRCEKEVPFTVTDEFSDTMKVTVHGKNLSFEMDGPSVIVSPSDLMRLVTLAVRHLTGRIRD